MNHSNNNFYDLSINGVKINITDISSNNFSQNRDFLDYTHQVKIIMCSKINYLHYINTIKIK